MVFARGLIVEKTGNPFGLVENQIRVRDAAARS